MKFGEKVFQTKLLSRLSHKVCRLLSSPVLLRKFTTKQQRRRRQRGRQKSNRFILAKQTLYCTFLSRRCKSVTWNFLISRARFMELLNTAQEFSFSLSKLRYGPLGFNPRQFRQDFKNKKKLNKIDEVWNSARKSLFKRRFRFVVIQKSCYHGNVT